MVNLLWRSILVRQGTLGSCAFDSESSLCLETREFCEMPSFVMESFGLINPCAP